MNKKSFKIIGLLVVLVSLFFVFNYSNKDIHEKDEASLSLNDNVEKVEENLVSRESSSVVLNFDFDDIVKSYRDEIEEGDTVFDSLVDVTEENNIEFSYKDYGGKMGVFITSIDNLGENQSRSNWWQYWVNEEYSKVGVSSYVLESGDEVLFKFTNSLQEYD